MEKTYFKRFISLPEQQSFFLFGPRGSGKTSLIQSRFSEKAVFIDLLKAEDERRFSLNPDELIHLLRSMPEKKTHLVIDEIQKIPKLLDLVHHLIEKSNKHFILTGSSARKLKYGGANLLAGRAFTYNLHPFSFFELEERADLKEVLQWGLIPRIFHLDDKKSKIDFLQSYSNTYLKEEVWAEHLVNKLEPFRKFLELAAQMNGKIINFSKIAQDVGVNDTSVKRYYALLEDTLLGFYLPAFQSSFRRQLSSKPKFYFFDIGLVKALNRSLILDLEESSYAFGNYFEHFIILEIIKLSSYYKYDYRFNYLKTKDDLEVDLIVDRPGLKPLFVEIKSSKMLQEKDLSRFRKIVEDFKDCEAICISREPYEKIFGKIRVLPWKQALREFFL